MDRRGFLRRAAALGTLLAAAALAEACQPAAAPPVPQPTRRPEQKPGAGQKTPPTAEPKPATSLEPVAALPGAAPGNAAIEHVVLVVVDGMMPEYLALSAFPNLRRLIASGTSFERAWVGHVVNDTPVSHTALISGKLPRETGIVYFYWRDADGKVVKMISPPMIEGDRFPSMVRERDLPSLGRVVKQHRPGAKVAAVGSAKDFAAVALGLDVADHVGYAVRLPSEQDKQDGTDQRRVDPRGDVLPDPASDGREGEGADVSPPNRRLVPGSPSWARLPDSLLNDPRFAMTTQQLGDNDVFAGNLAVGVVEALKPTVLLVNLPDTDQIGHLTGGSTTNPAAVTQTMTAADAQIGRLLEAYTKAGLMERTLWVVTSDHGMTPNGANINPRVVEKTLKQAGFPILAGDTSHYWLREPAQAAAAAAAIDAQQAPGLLGTYAKLDQGNGRFVYQPSAAARSNLSADQRTALEWLFETFVGPESPDVTFILGENVHFHTAPPNTIGAHSEPTWLLQRIPLVFSGPGVRPGAVAPYPARLVDIAPTILALLDLPADRMDGVVLADVLATSAEKTRQAQLSSPEAQRMRRYQDVLAQLSASAPRA